MSTAEYKQLDTVISSVGAETDTPDQQGKFNINGLPCLTDNQHCTNLLL